MTFLEENGYEIFRGVFSSLKMAALEIELIQTPQKTLADVMLHPLILAIAHKICGPLLQTTGENHVNVGEIKALYRDLHRDYPAGTARVIPLYRFALYFRDYTNHSGGLMVIPKSHTQKGLKPIVLQTHPGDLAVWNCRALHAAGANNDGKPIAVPRNAVFFDYGAPCEELEAYKKYREERAPT